MPWGYVAAATIGSSLIGADAAQNAAETQAQGARDAAAVNKAMFDVQNEQQKPYREAGYTALSDIAGMKPYLQHQFNTEDLAAGLAPNYDFMLQQGQMANQRAANAAGGGLGGNALQGLNKFTQDYAGNAYQNAFTNYQNQRGNIYNTLASIAGLGQTSLGQTTQAGTQTAGNIANAVSNAASAGAAGQVGAANAIGGGLTGAANTNLLANLIKPQTSNPAYTPTTNYGSNANYDLTTGQNVGGLGLNLRT